MCILLVGGHKLGNDTAQSDYFLRYSLYEDREIFNVYIMQASPYSKLHASFGSDGYSDGWIESSSTITRDTCGNGSEHIYLQIMQIFY